jgi:hypothetical protein
MLVGTHGGGDEVAKATLTLPDGTTVSISGSPEEIASIMSLHGGTTRSQRKSPAPAAKHRAKPIEPTKKKKPKAGPKQRVQALIDAGFFKEQRSIVHIQTKLEEEGHIYAQSSLSPALVRLTREKALRRVKHDKLWAYVNP